MENIAKEANRFARLYINESYTRRIAQDSLEDQLNSYRTDKTKLFFLTELRKIVSDEKVSHEAGCNVQNCQKSEAFNTALFLIDEELDVLNEYFIPEVKTEKSFTYSDMANLHSKLDEILERFEKVDFGHQIIGEELENIAEEIDTLKQHFSLDKKSWFQFAFVKLASIGATYGIEETVIKGMYNELTQQVENAANLFIQ